MSGKTLTIMLSAAVLAAAAAAGAQTEKKISRKDLPPAVRSSFEKRFPGARVLGTSSEIDKGSTVYEVESEWQGRRHDVTFRTDGALVSDEETIPLQEAPAAVLAALKKEFPKAQVARAEKILEDGQVSYEFQLKGAAKKEAKFSSTGKLLGSE